MLRTLCLALVAAAAAVAQSAAGPATPPGKLASLEQTARQTAAQWDQLAQGLESSLTRMLPCDPRVAAAINRVQQASAARLAALAEYLGAAGQQVSAETDAAKRELAAGETFTATVATERTHSTAEMAAAQGQRSNLADSFGSARRALDQVVAEQRQRADLLRARLDVQASLIPALRDIVAAATTREAAWKDVMNAYEAERARWNAYYAARLARSQTECSITRTNIGGAAPRKP